MLYCHSISFVVHGKLVPFVNPVVVLRMTRLYFFGIASIKEISLKYTNNFSALFWNLFLF